MAEPIENRLIVMDLSDEELLSHFVYITPPPQHQFADFATRLHEEIMAALQIPTEILSSDERRQL